jgi:outer membrane protein assembly factor BamB
MRGAGRHSRSLPRRGALLVVFVLVAAGCDWTSFGFGNGNTHDNPTETAIGVGNVAKLKVAWTSVPSDQSFSTSPVVATGRVFVGSTQLHAYSANGSTGCSGSSPKTCVPLWIADPSGGNAAGDFSSPVVKDGVVYAVWDDFFSSDADVYAFDAAGSIGCSGSPKFCEPLWKASAAGVVKFSSPPKVVNGVVYVGAADGTLYAFDAAGSTGCAGTPVRTCAPLWTAATGREIDATPAVVNGIVYVGAADGRLFGFDAAGSTGCAGTPVKTCAPLWKAATAGAISGSPAVANGVVYVGATDGTFYAFDATGGAGCSGVPKTCAPLWTASVIASGAFPAVANGIVYVGADTDDQHPGLSAFDAAGSTGCSGVPKHCQPLWTAPGHLGVTESPTVANGVVYVGDQDTRVYAYDAAGSTGCSGIPKVCGSLWSFSTPHGSVHASPVVANGFVYVASGNGTFYAFHL